MHLEFLVEEPSAEAALSNVVPKIVAGAVTSAFHSYQGKPHLLSHLSPRLRGYRSWLPEDWKIIVVVDEDRQDCRELKQTLEHAANHAHFRTRTTHPADWEVVNRIAIEELEAWFLGDAAAVTAAYPKVPPHFTTRARYRDPDGVAGGTWEALEDLLQAAGYYRGGMSKIEVARAVSGFMEPSRNRSRSFNLFAQTLRELTARTS